MKRIGALGIFLTCLAMQAAWADQGEARATARKALADAIDGRPKITGSFDIPSEGYFQGYQILLKADRTEDAVETKRLRLQALGLFGQVKERFPDWKPDVLNLRIQAVRNLLGLPDGE